MNTTNANTNTNTNTNTNNAYMEAFRSHLDEAIGLFRRAPEKGYAELRKEGSALLRAAGGNVTAVVISPRYSAFSVAATDFETGAL